MSKMRRNPSVLSVIEREALAFGCPRCGAIPGAWCLNYTGQPAVSLHSPRIDLAETRPTPPVRGSTESVGPPR